MSGWLNEEYVACELNFVMLVCGRIASLRDVVVQQSWQEVDYYGAGGNALVTETHINNYPEFPNINGGGWFYRVI